MNDVERMRIDCDALQRRVRKLEVYFEERVIFNDDEKEAQRAAEQLGFPVEILIIPRKRGARQLGVHRLVARQLRSRNRWPVSRIARALHVCESTARDWTL